MKTKEARSGIRFAITVVFIAGLASVIAVSGSDKLTDKKALSVGYRDPKQMERDLVTEFRRIRSGDVGFVDTTNEDGTTTKEYTGNESIRTIWKNNPKVQEIMKKWENTNRTVGQESMALQFELLPSGLREMKIMMAGLYSGLTEEQAREQARISEQQRIFTVGQANMDPNESWNQSMRQAGEIIIVEMQDKEVFNAAKVCDDATLAIEIIVHNDLGVPWPVAGSNEAEIEMYSMKTISDWTHRELKDEQKREDYLARAASPGWIATTTRVRSMCMLGLAGIADWIPKLTEHIYFAISEAV
jgi:hypothetical protein